MSETQPKSRPWHGHANPMDALHDWMVKELAALEQRLKPDAVQAPSPKVEPPKPAETIAAPVAHPVPPVVPAPKPADA